MGEQHHPPRKRLPWTFYAAIGAVALLALVVYVAARPNGGPETGWVLVGLALVMAYSVIMIRVRTMRTRPEHEYKGRTPPWVLDWMDKQGFTLLSATANTVDSLGKRQGRFLAVACYSLKPDSEVAFIEAEAALTDVDTGVYVYKGADNTIHVLVDTYRVSGAAPIDGSKQRSTAQYHVRPAHSVA